MHRLFFTMDFETKLIKLLFMSLTVILSLEYSNCKENRECIVNDSKGCTCNFTDGSGVVDLRRLGNRDNTPRFKRAEGTDGFLYSYNPCYGFNEGACGNAAVCLFKNESQTQIGDAGSAKFEYVENYGVVAVYTIHPYGAVSMVQVSCDPKAVEPDFKAFGESAPGFYVFQLISMCGCPGFCTDTGLSASTSRINV